ncbi:MAG: SMI1/KNR4 family protein [Acutalibacteraceae bacterium]|nr:SMI1/KNR4 family protein [Acutalibacteraceae bacterium]
MQLDKIMEEICSRWNLPKNYIEFLNNNKDNIYTDVGDEESDLYSYGDDIEIYGATGLIEGQLGYSYNPIQKAVIEDWNPDYIVIANCNADPYCIDISLDNSPVYYAMHGTGEWRFKKVSESLEEFFDFLGI